ncbi:MAG: NAD+ synthase [Parachlamydiales bacterium]
MRIYAAQLNPTIGALKGNTQKILAAIDRGREQGADLILLPELAISGYPPEDLLLLESFVPACEAMLEPIIEASKGLAVVVGLPRRATKGEKPFHNSAAIIEEGKLLGFQDKTCLPTYDVFDERRYFEPSPKNQVWKLRGERVAITICEDIWGWEEPIVLADYRRHPVEELASARPTFHLNLSASPYSFEKFPMRLEALQRASQHLKVPSLLCNQVGGNDSLIFDGHTFLIDREGRVLARAKGFAEDNLLIDTRKLPPPLVLEENPYGELYRALVMGVRDYFEKSGFKTACLGLSGGIDSALVAAIGADALGPQNILGLLMPGPYNPPSSLEDAQLLAQNLGIKTLTLPIGPLYETFLTTLTPHFEGKAPDTTEENLQARIRGMLLMAISNKHGHIVLSTGNKSEMATGYATLYGDMCGGLGVLSDVPKMKVYALCKHLNREGERIPHNILVKPPSAELAEGQVDADTLPPYSIVDQVLEDYVQRHLSPETIAERRSLPFPIVLDLVKRIHRNEYKRRQAPPGLRVTEKAFSVGRRFPIVQKWS